jgi:hypothetical protein
MALDNLRQAAQGVITGNLRRVAGNLPGMLGGGRGDNSSKYKKLDRAKSPHSVDNLQFPIDVDSDPGLGNHGHYMMFYINQQDHAKLSFGDPAEPKQSGVDNTVKALKEHGVTAVKNEVVKPAKDTTVTVDNKALFQNRDPITGATIDRTVEVGDKVKTSNAQYAQTNYNDSIGKHIINQAGSNQVKIGDSSGIQNMDFAASQGTKKETKFSKEAQAIHVQRAATTRLKTAIALYMPASVQVTYGANYTDTEIGSLAERAAEVIKKFQEGNIKGGFQGILDSDETLLQNAGQFLLAGVGNLPGFGGAKELEAMKAGRIISNRMELAFKGINKRSFQYTFKMMPRNKKEADEIKKIVHAFKFNMLPEFEGSDLSGRSFIVPNTFDIEYMYNGKENQFLHKISTCVLESMNVTYGGDRYKTYTATAEGAPPQETTISLNFKEMEMITRERVALGF